MGQPLQRSQSSTAMCSLQRPKSSGAISGADRLERTVLRTWRGSSWAPFAPQRGLSSSSSGALESMTKSQRNAELLCSENKTAQIQGHLAPHHAWEIDDGVLDASSIGKDQHCRRSLTTATPAVSPYAQL